MMFQSFLKLVSFSDQVFFPTFSSKLLILSFASSNLLFIFSSVFWMSYMVLFISELFFFMVSMCLFIPLLFSLSSLSTLISINLNSLSVKLLAFILFCSFSVVYSCFFIWGLCVCFCDLERTAMTLSWWGGLLWGSLMQSP
uniref:Uncharacterized protein n=1 Tax=Molossus molossus TaxID=27622 RepID=A0A7J8B8I4_MOLMO|nr:hypothetical protein HJG59_010730 [Molossus molossus]